jgi:hypothetical protein
MRSSVSDFAAFVACKDGNNVCSDNADIEVMSLYPFICVRCFDWFAQNV